MSRRELRLPNTTLNLVPSKELEERLMMLRPIENLVLRCPAYSPESNVVIAALTTWLQTHQAHNVQTHPYAALVTHIQSTEDKHLDMWRQLGLSPMAWERLWTAIRLIKAHGPPKRITVRHGGHSAEPRRTPSSCRGDQRAHPPRQIPKHQVLRAVHGPRRHRRSHCARCPAAARSPNGICAVRLAHKPGVSGHVCTGGRTNGQKEKIPCVLVRSVSAQKSVAGV
jgi:hypothetical protein